MTTAIRPRTPNPSKTEGPTSGAHLLVAGLAETRVPSDSTVRPHEVDENEIGQLLTELDHDNLVISPNYLGRDRRSTPQGPANGSPGTLEVFGRRAGDLDLTASRDTHHVAPTRISLPATSRAVETRVRPRSTVVMVVATAVVTLLVSVPVAMALTPGTATSGSTHTATAAMGNSPRPSSKPSEGIHRHRIRGGARSAGHGTPRVSPASGPVLRQANKSAAVERRALRAEQRSAAALARSERHQERLATSVAKGAARLSRTTAVGKGSR